MRQRKCAPKVKKRRFWAKRLVFRKPRNSRASEAFSYK